MQPTPFHVSANLGPYLRRILANPPAKHYCTSSPPIILLNPTTSAARIVVNLRSMPVMEWLLASAPMAGPGDDKPGGRLAKLSGKRPVPSRAAPEFLVSSGNKISAQLSYNFSDFYEMYFDF